MPYGMVFLSEIIRNLQHTCSNAYTYIILISWDYSNLVYQVWHLPDVKKSEDSSNKELNTNFQGWYSDTCIM